MAVLTIHFDKLCTKMILFENARTHMDMSQDDSQVGMRQVFISRPLCENCYTFIYEIWNIHRPYTVVLQPGYYH